MSGERANPASRTTTTTTKTRVVLVARPMGRNRENGPHLLDLRDFVEACHGLPDDARVRIGEGQLSEGGDRDVTFAVEVTEKP